MEFDEIGQFTMLTLSTTKICRQRANQVHHFLSVMEHLCQEVYGQSYDRLHARLLQIPVTE
ncbi:hypothetical protein [Bacillus sp. KH172YL63]|uniref:hypothetical protein n=1 Tax=Bacillus sp. KH172YL63 TaxID=2709784 RepID=UPI0015675496|nr:hypothetical protein [Bacillus sp. KH172YL63]